MRVRTRRLKQGNEKRTHWSLIDTKPWAFNHSLFIAICVIGVRDMAYCPFELNPVLLASLNLTSKLTSK
jgi:hypothetical protein